jgi:leader peptidase (prepilin peptidase)/N-methyltransferase
VVSGIWWLVRRVQGFGLGDAKMLAMMGAFLGVEGIAVTLFVATMAGSLVGLFFVARRDLDMGSKLPFGSFLAFGGLLALFFGPEIVSWYLGFY